LYPKQAQQQSSYWLAGLSVLSLLITLLIVSFPQVNAQNDMPQIWATVAGDVTFSEDYSEVLDMTSDAFVVIEERNGKTSKKVKMTKALGGSLSIELQEIIGAFAYSYSENGEDNTFDENVLAWYKSAYQKSLQHLLNKAPSDDKTSIMTDNDIFDGYRVSFFAMPETTSMSVFSNPSGALWDSLPSKASLIEGFQDYLIYQRQSHSAGLLSDRSYAGFLDGMTADYNFPNELFPETLEHAQDIKDIQLREQLTSLIQQRSQKIDNSDPLVFIFTNQATSKFGRWDENPSPDGKNRISGNITDNAKPAAHHMVSISIPLDAETNPGMIIANTRSDKNGYFTFSGFDIPSGSYDLSFEETQDFQGTGYSFTVDKQEIEFTGNLIRRTQPIAPQKGDVVSTTPTFSWDAIPDAIRYSVSVYATTTWEQVVFQYVESPSLTLELPLEPNTEYQWSFDAYNEEGAVITSGYVDSFRTE
jgi:hypothetical protein